MRYSLITLALLTATGIGYAAAPSPSTQPSAKPMMMPGGMVMEKKMGDMKTTETPATQPTGASCCCMGNMKDMMQMMMNMQSSMENMSGGATRTTQPAASQANPHAAHHQ